MNRKTLAAAVAAALLCVMAAVQAAAAPPSAALNDSVRPPDDISVKSYGDPVPIGTVMAWPASGALPEGWLECNGTLVSASDYPVLAALTGGTLPDYRGLFLRGTGGNAAALGTLQLPSIRPHQHTFSAAATRVIANGAEGLTHFSAGVSGGPVIYDGFEAPSVERILSAQASGGTSRASTAQSGEHTLNARPVHAAVRWIIKAKLIED